MESTVFAENGDKNRLVILDLLREQKMVVHFKFTHEAKAYFKKKYPDEYKHHLLNANDELSFVSRIDTVKGSFIGVTKLTYLGSDGNNDSCYQVFTCPNRPDGIPLEFQAHHVCGISINKTKIE